MATSKKQAKKPAPKPKSGVKAKAAPAKVVRAQPMKKPAPKPTKAAPAKATPAKAVPTKKQSPTKSTTKPTKAAPAKATPAKVVSTQSTKKAAPVKTLPKPAKAAPAKAAPTKAATKAAGAKAAVKPAKETPAKGASAKAGAAAKAAAATAAAPAAAPLRAGVPPPRIRTKSKEKPIPRLTKTPYDAKFLAEQRTMLLEERARYSKSATKYRVEADSLVSDREPGDVQFDEESGEGDSLAVERDFDLALSAQAQDKVAEIDAALARIADSTYGICITSGQAIPKERLRAIPWATERIEYKVGGLGRRH
jgi:RNA polymerase-binding transcription factor DksA